MSKLEIASLVSEMHAAVGGLKQIREAYDRRVAFRFNAIHTFVRPDENRLSDIIAFLIDPAETHAQGDVFLRAFLKRFDLQRPLELLDLGSRAVVQREHSTDQRRRVDITVSFGEREYVVGIENKPWARDQHQQVHDYVAYLGEIARSDCYTLFYLTPDGAEPGEGSVPEGRRNQLMGTGRLRVASYKEDMVELVERFESVCHAESVRAFLRDLQVYFRREFRKEGDMSEANYIETFVKEHPEVVQYIDGLSRAREVYRTRYHNLFWNAVAEQLRQAGTAMDASALERVSRSYKFVVVSRDGLSAALGELRDVAVFYEPSRSFREYIAIGLPDSKSKLPQSLLSRVRALESELAAREFTMADNSDGWRWAACVALPVLNLDNDEELASLIRHDAKSSLLQEKAGETAKRISMYLDTATEVWASLRA